MSEPTRSRAVLSNEDYKLMQEAVRFYIQNNKESDVTAKYVNLYHRLGSAMHR
jgi:hypothetical protein